MLHNLTGWHLIVVLAVVLLLFGTAKLPALARSMGQSARAFKGEMRAMKEEERTSGEPTATPERDRPVGGRSDGEPNARGPLGEHRDAPTMGR
jgi:sec-independent protein translocase protein TatA